MRGFFFWGCFYLNSSHHHRNQTQNGSPLFQTLYQTLLEPKSYIQYVGYVVGLVILEIITPSPKYTLHQENEPTNPRFAKYWGLDPHPGRAIPDPPLPALRRPAPPRPPLPTLRLPRRWSHWRASASPNQSTSGSYTTHLTPPYYGLY